MGLPAYIGNTKPERQLIESFFHHMRLPEPNEKEIHRTQDEGLLLFLNGYGCTVRITPHDRRVDFDSPNFLKPVFSKSSACFHVAIMPGVECPMGVFDTMHLQIMLKQDQHISINPADAHIANFGFVPTTRFPVMLDVDRAYVKKAVLSEACARLWDKIRPVSFRLNRAERSSRLQRFDRQDPQEELYAPLRQIMEMAWPCDADVPDPEGVKEFWRTCLDFRQKGKLVDGWSKSKRTKFSSKALSYQDKLIKAPPHL